MSNGSIKKKLSSSGLTIKSFYGKSNPGEYPYTSGIYPNMYRSKLWTMRQYAGFSSASKSNERYKYLLDQGVGLPLKECDSNDIYNQLKTIFSNAPLQFRTATAGSPFALSRAGAAS